jgi:hypothetical protein
MTSGKASSSITCSSSSWSSSAQVVVQQAATQLGLLATPTGDTNDNNELLESICRRMREEHVDEKWQLELIDSFQWKELGAPIGLVAAVRSIISSTNDTEHHDQQQSGRNNINNNNKRAVQEMTGATDGEKSTKKSK